MTSRGRLFEFENGNPVNAPTDLSTIPLYAAGPCMGRGPGACTLETQAFVLLPGNRLVEYVTFAGRQWTFEANQMTGAGVDLAAIPRYQDMCALRGASGGLCKLDTRVFYKVNAEIVESITAYGRRFEYNLDGARLPNSGIDLLQIPQYAAGPCRGRAPGTCTLETRSYEMLNGQLVETITAQGLVYRYLVNGQELPGNGAPVTSAAHWANGPCR